MTVLPAISEIDTAAPARASLLDRKRGVMMPCLYHFHGDDPLHLVRGEGMHVWDAEGRAYLDFFAGVAVNALGHCHPEVVEAAAEQLRTLQHTTTIYLTEPMIALAERLVALAPAPLARVYFCADGSGAVEGAAWAARQATGRTDFIALDRALHGRTALAKELTGLAMWRDAEPVVAPAARVHRASSPLGRSADEAAAEIEAIVAAARPDSIAAFIAEPIQGNGGIVPAPPGYFQAVQRPLRRHGILLIVDEVQTGFCRTGRWFGIEHWMGAEPDLMAVAKALAGGLPAAAWLASERVAQACTRASASTFGGNLVAMAAGLKTLQIMERDGLAGRAERLGGRLGRGLADVAARHDGIVATRGLGLMRGAELRAMSAGDSATDAAERVILALRRRGILAGKTGPERNVVTFQPPLIVDASEIDIALEAFESAVVEAART